MFQPLRLEALRLHPEAFGASVEEELMDYARIDVAEQRGNHPVSKIRRQLETVGDFLLLAIVIRVLDGDLPGGDVEGHVDGALECRALLD